MMALLLGSVPWQGAAASEMESAKEYELKAAYIYNFTKFTSWPITSFPDESAPLMIWVLGNERIAAALETLVKGHTSNGRPISVRAVPRASDREGLHVLYVDVSQDAKLTAVKAAFSSPGLLTVGESQRFADLGGAIRLIVEGERLQFEISSQATQRAGLTLSSQLLMLAKAVRKAP